MPQSRPIAGQSFGVPKDSGRTTKDVREELLNTLAGWIGAAIPIPA